MKSTRIRVESLHFSVPWFVVLSVWVSAVYAKYVSKPIHSIEFPQKKSVPKQTQTRIPIVRIDNFSLVSLRFSVPWFMVLSVWVSAVYAKYVSTPIHSVEFSQKKSVPTQTRIPIVCVDNFSLVSLRFSAPWFIVLLVWVSAVYAKYVSTPIHSVEFPQKKSVPKKTGFPSSTLIILDWSNENLNWSWKNKIHD